MTRCDDGCKEEEVYIIRLNNVPTVSPWPRELRAGLFCQPTILPPLIDLSLILDIGPRFHPFLTMPSANNGGGGGSGSSYETFEIPDFTFASGAKQSVKIAYQSINPTSTKGTVLIPTCFGGRINTTLTFTTGALREYYVVVVAMLGNGESSSPSNDETFPPDYSLRYQVRFFFFFLSF